MFLFRRTASFLLASFFLLVPLCVRADSSYKSYVSLGDSIPAGFTAEGNNLREGSFSDIVASYTDAFYSDFSVSGLYTAQLPDVISRNAGVVRDADLITLCIGGNDCLGSVDRGFSRAVPDGEGGIADPAPLFACAASDPNFDSKLSQSLFTSLSDSAKEYPAVWQKALAALRSVNRNAKLVVVNICNPFSLIVQRLNGACDKLTLAANECRLTVAGSDFSDAAVRASLCEHLYALGFTKKDIESYSARLTEESSRAECVTALDSLLAAYVDSASDIRAVFSDGEVYDAAVGLIESCNRVIDSASTRFSYEVADSFSALTPDCFQTDGVHPSAKGHAAIAEKVLLLLGFIEPVSSADTSSALSDVSLAADSQDSGEKSDKGVTLFLIIAGSISAAAVIASCTAIYVIRKKRCNEDNQ